MRITALIIATCGLAFGLSGCGAYEDLQSITGTSRSQSNLALKNPPLSLPPDYALRPPANSAKRAGGDAAARKARTVLRTGSAASANPVAQRIGDRSPGESALLRQAGLRRTTSSVVKKVVDIEGQRAKDAERNFVNKLVKYKPGQKAKETKGDKSVRSATPDKPVIKRDGEL